MSTRTKFEIVSGMTLMLSGIAIASFLLIRFLFSGLNLIFGI